MIYICLPLVLLLPPFALSEFKKCGFPIKDLNTFKDKQEMTASVATIFDHGGCFYYYLEDCIDNEVDMKYSLDGL
jgi:hypothetical protein